MMLQVHLRKLKQKKMMKNHQRILLLQMNQNQAGIQVTMVINATINQNNSINNLEAEPGEEALIVAEDSVKHTSTMVEEEEVIITVEDEEEDMDTEEALIVAEDSVKHALTM